MSTIIDLGRGAFIAGDPAEALGEREHWCGSCAGSGLEYDYDNELQPCLSCNGSGIVQCGEPDCVEHE